MNLNRYTMEWPRLWSIIQQELRRRGYQRSTLLIYRHVLRRFAHHTENRPCYVRPEDAQSYIHGLTGHSWSWISVNIAVLRTVFDKLGALSITRSLVTPKRPQHLPVILSMNEIQRLLAAAPTARDQLLLGLLYGCGLTVGEASRIRWRHVSAVHKTVQVHKNGNPDAPERTVRLPSQLLPLLLRGLEVCRPDDYVFVGRSSGHHLSTRMAARLLRNIVRTAGLEKPVCGMTLRHSYAVHALQAGATIREVQEALGHERIETTLIYEHCMLPGDTVSPAEALTKLDIAHPVALPFPPDKARHGRIGAFWNNLKSQLNHRFLAQRGESPFSTGPPG